MLKPWCATAARSELLKAEAEWHDVAGRADADATLWTWAWSRFPPLVYEGLSGVNETREVVVTLKDGTSLVGYPDGRRSRQGQLVLAASSATDRHQYEEYGPFSIDDVAEVRESPVL